MKTIAVIGGGITGVTTAYALARRGFSVTLFEKQRYAAKPSQPMNREQRRAAAKQQRKQKPVSRSEGFHPQVASRPAQQPITQTNTFWPATEIGTRRKTDQLIDARQAVNALRDDPDAMQQLAAYALQIAAERHV